MTRLMATWVDGDGCVEGGMRRMRSAELIASVSLRAQFAKQSRPKVKRMDKTDAELVAKILEQIGKRSQSLYGKNYW